MALKRMGGYKDLIKEVKLTLEADYSALRGKMSCGNLGFCYSACMYMHKGKVVACFCKFVWTHLRHSFPHAISLTIVVEPGF